MLNSIKQKLEQINLIKVTKYKKAGVLILLLNDIETNKTQILYTKRSSKLSTHSGEVSFPGGMWEEEDASLLDTAMRESNEEIGLKISNVEMLGKLNYLLSRHKIEVNPYVGYLMNHQEFIGNFEIEEIFTVPLTFLFPSLIVWIVTQLIRALASSVANIRLVVVTKLKSINFLHQIFLNQF